MKLRDKLVFVNGCFDLLHSGHIKLFETARSLGNGLIVAIDSDRRVKEMKGPERPIRSQDERKIILESIRYIDSVLIFDSEEDLTIIVKELEPDIMMVGSDWKGKEIVGSDYAKEVRFFDRVGDYSTTKIIESIANR
jgi:rfaE bifunctional protein nucleotidyltransferase chain/domain